jgi:maltooligosyltrehalose trehalohydrolase
MTAVLLLFPGTPMLFMGQEFAAPTPFYYFADHNPDLAKLVRAGRAEFMTQFRTLDRPDLAAWLPEPGAAATFERCKLDFADRARNAREYRLHKDLLRLRREDPAFRARDQRWVDGAVLGPEAFVVRFFEGAPDGTRDRLLLVNLGRDLYLDQAPEPLLAAPEGHRWNVLWSSESLDYGGNGTPPPEAVDGWRVLGEAAVLLAPEPLPPHDRGAAHKAAEERAKERMRRERTPLEE